jgi:hypothetical protein
MEHLERQVDLLQVGAGGGFLTGVNVTTDQAPDILVKAALDPGWGHYELFGIQRFFTDSTFCSTALPVIPRYVDVQGSIM